MQQSQTSDYGKYDKNHAKRKRGRPRKHAERMEIQPGEVLEKPEENIVLFLALKLP
jgi:hypothetical protein